MSKSVKKILVAGVSLLMFASVNTGISNMHTSVYATSQSRFKKANLSKNRTKKVTKQARDHKLHEVAKLSRNRSSRMSHHNKRNSQKAIIHHSYRGKNYKKTKFNSSRQYKQGFKVSENFDFLPSTYRGFKFQDNEYYKGLHHSMTKAYKKGFLEGAEKAGRTSAFEGAGFAIYHPKFQRRAFKHARKTSINSLNAWKYSLKHAYNHNFNLGEKAELGLIGNGSSIPKSMKYLKHNRNFKNGWITAYDYTLGVSLKPNHLSNSNYDSYINS